MAGERVGGFAGVRVRGFVRGLVRGIHTDGGLPLFTLVHKYDVLTVRSVQTVARLKLSLFIHAVILLLIVQRTAFARLGLFHYKQQTPIFKLLSNGVL